MLAKTLPLLVLCACASTPLPPAAMADQPELAGMTRPYAQQLQAVGVTRVISPGSGAMVRVETRNGPIYLRYPAVVEPLAFTLDFDSGDVRATAATFDRAKDGQILAALLPEAVRATDANNTLAWMRANPWH